MAGRKKTGMKFYKDADADLGALVGKTIAVIGFGSQGQAQCLNMRDSGIKVIVGLKKGSKSLGNARRMGFDVFGTAEAARRGDIIHLLAPDEMHSEIYEKDIRENLGDGKTLSFSHGFSITFGLINPPKNADVILVSPKAPGKSLRENYSNGLGVPGVFAVHQDYSGNAKSTALALARAIGLTKAGLGECTFDEETHINLFAEQAVLCGGLSELVKAGFDTLAGKGYPPELVYIEVVQQMKLLAGLIHSGGIPYMWSEVSNTAEYGGRTRGSRVVGARAREEMKKILAEIMSGKFAREWMREYSSGMGKTQRLRALGGKEKISIAGRKVRELFRGR